MKKILLLGALCTAVLSATALQAITPQDWFNTYVQGKIEESDQACLRDIIIASLDTTPAAADAALADAIQGIKGEDAGELDPVDQASVGALQALRGVANLATFADVITTDAVCSDEAE